MAQTLITSADNLAVRLQSVALQAESLRRSVFVRMMAGRQPKERAALAKRERMQTTAHMPIVSITDLQQMAGDKVTCDMFRIVSGKPFMGDRKMQGQGAPQRFASMEIKINQSRFPMDAGSRMTQKRTRHNLRSIARANMSDYFGRLNDQVILVHLGGERGSENTEDWNVPLSNDPDFADIMINPVVPPSKNRHFFAGGGTSITELEATDALKLEDLDVISAKLREMPFPPAPIKVESDPLNDEEPIWCLIVTERQWHYMLARAGANSAAWRKFLADATMRKSVNKHPLFMGTTGLWNGLLIKRMSRAIRFNPGDTIKESNDDGSTVDRVVPAALNLAGAAVDRAILLGGQALALARGDANGGNASYPMRWTEVLDDHGNSLEIGGGQIDGKAKFRYRGSDGKVTDFGCGVIDSYAPDPASDAGQRLRTSLAA